jgi:gas vesicle protein
MSSDGFKLNYFVVGLALGALAGMVFAPRRGDEMRDEMRRRTHEGLDYLNQQAERLRDSTEKVVNKTRDWMSRATDGWSSSPAKDTAEDEQAPSM